MKAEQVIKQLRYWLPRFSNLFTDQLNVVSLTMDAFQVVTASTDVPHGLETNDYVNVVGAVTENPLISLTRNGFIASAETQYDHDLTERNPSDSKNYIPTVEVSGADQIEYNGEHILLKVPNRKTFTYQITGSPATPATGSPVLEYEYSIGYNGRHKITKINDTTFTYVSDVLRPPTTTGTIIAHISSRISGAVDIQRAVASYTPEQTNKWWIFVIIDDVTSSKNRSIASDANDTQGSATDFRQLLIQNVNLLVFAPTTKDLSGRKTKDDMQDLTAALFKSILGVNFPDNFSTPSPWGLTFLGHGVLEYNTAYYVHNYKFQELKQINWFDTSLELENNVAFRDIEINYFSEENNNDIMQSIIDLDDEPID